MFRLLGLLIILPWWSYVMLAGGVGYLAEHLYQVQLEIEAEKVVALEALPPAAVNLSDFSREEHIGPVDEATVTGWFNFDYNYNLVQKTNGIKTGNTYMYVMFGEDDDAATKTAKAVIIMSPDRKDWFLENMDTYYEWSTNENGHFQYTFNGFAAPTHSHSSHVSDVFSDEGLRKSADFVFLTPFWEGREAALVPQGDPQKTRNTGWMIAAFIALIGLGKFLFKRSRSGASRKHSRGDIFANSPIAGVKSARPVPQIRPQTQPQTAMANNIATDSPMGRLMQNQAEATQMVQDPFADIGAGGAAAMRPKDQSAAKPRQRVRRVKAAGITSGQRLIGGMIMIAIGALMFGPDLGFLIPLAIIAGFWFCVYAGMNKLGGLFGDLTKKARATDPFERLRR